VLRDDRRDRGELSNTTTGAGTHSRPDTRRVDRGV